MREYKPKDNVQKQAYYSDRFRAPDEIEKEDVSTDYIYAELEQKLKATFQIVDSYLMRKEWVVIINPEDNFNVLEFFKDELGFIQLTEMSAIDWVATDDQFEIFYQLLNFEKVKRVRIKCRIFNGNNIESVTRLFSSANWAEREMHDMFGIYVNNHPNLKRLLLPDDWSGHPLLKTYPLQGDETANWFEVDKIYGQSARDIIGPEQRDAAFVAIKDTTRFARVGHEVGKGEEYSNEITPIRYQEDEKPALFADFRNKPKAGDPRKGV